MASTKKTSAKPLIVRPRRTEREVNYKKLYPWAHNEFKIKRAHKAIIDENEQLQAQGKAKLGAEDFQQAVLDHYTTHGGLVLGHESITIVGRRGLMKKNFAVGKSTTDVVGKDITGTGEDEEEQPEEMAPVPTDDTDAVPADDE